MAAKVNSTRNMDCFTVRNANTAWMLERDITLFASDTQQQL